MALVRSPSSSLVSSSVTTLSSDTQPATILQWSLTHPHPSSSEYLRYFKLLTPPDLIPAFCDFLVLWDFSFERCNSMPRLECPIKLYILGRRGPPIDSFCSPPLENYRLAERKLIKLVTDWQWCFRCQHLLK